MKPIDDCRTGKAPENQNKNRYRDILPCKYAQKQEHTFGEQNHQRNTKKIFWTLEVFLNCSNRTTHAKMCSISIFSDAVYIFLEVLAYNTNTQWQHSYATHEKQHWVLYVGTLANNSIVIRRLFTVLHKYLKRNKAAMNHTIYLWESLLSLVNISATSQMCSKIQRDTFLERLRFPISWVLETVELLFQIHSWNSIFLFLYRW